ncbi:MAG: alanine--glyoxylate aminotransferase family protein [Aquificae bacterium]|nr:alanine--glyoxylate aminotransferase family protein [Aquificota bacterium]
MKFFNFKGERIFTPGPVELPDPVREALGRQIIHHRTEEFREVFLETRELFKRLVDSGSENFVFFASSGTGAMEAAVQNFFRPGEKVIAVVGGKFGERWAELGKTWGLEVIPLEVEWGKSVDPQQVEDLLKKEGDVKGVLVQMSESSTGAYHDVYSLAQLTKDRDTLLVVDAITALGVYDIKPHERGIDVLIGGSQKAFMLPPGLSMLWFSEKAARHLTSRSYYFNVAEELKKQREGQTAFTPAISLIMALKESLELLLSIGTENLEKKYGIMAHATRRTAEALGLSVFPENPVISLTALRPPEGVEADSLRKVLLSMGMRVAGGQGKLKGKIIRISHMGMDYMDMVSLLGALELALKSLGRPVREGEGVGEYLQVIYSQTSG